LYRGRSGALMGVPSDARDDAGTSLRRHPHFT
jgi:hypothetical protein